MKDSNQNALRKRLYLNYSTKTQSSDPSKKSVKKNSMSGTLLIPKIYAETHKKAEGYDRTTMNFRDGKIVVDNSIQSFRRSADRFRQPKECRDAKELLREPMQPIEATQLSNEARSIIEASKGMEVRKMRRGDERNLTPQNIFSFFETFPEMQLDFFYLNKHSHPYDYRIVPFGERNPLEYMTISCKGVTQFLHGEAHFMTREEWLLEESMYRQLQQIDFFRKYKVNKNFRIWKNMMKRHYMKEMSNMLNERLFAAGNSQQALLTIRQHCLGLEDECKMLNYDLHQPYTLEECRAEVHRYQNDEFLSAVSRFEQKITVELANSIEQSLEAYREENNLGEHKKDGKSDDKMDYSKEALLRTHYGKVTRLIKLVESLLLESKATMVQNNLQQLLDTLRAINQEQKSDQWLLCKADWNGHILQLSPDRNKVKEWFLSIVQDALKVLHHQNFNLEQQVQFKKYRPDEEGSRVDTKKEEKLTLKAICNLNEEYQNKLCEINDQIDFAFDRVEEEQLKVMEFANIYEKHQRSREMGIDDLGAAEIRRIIAEYREEDLRMDCMQEKAELGLVLLDFTELRLRMRSAPALSRARLLELLPGLITSKSNSLCSQIKQFSSALSNPPLSVKTFVKYTKDVNRVSSCLEELSGSSGELIQLVSMMEELRLSNIEKYRLKVREASSGVADLRIKVDEANANYDQNLSKFKKELGHNVQKIETGLGQLAVRYSDTPLNKSDSSIDTMIEFIESAKGHVQALEEQALQTNNLQAELSLNKSSFENLANFTREFYLVEKLWVGRREWKNTVTWVGSCHFLQVKHEDFKAQHDKAMLLASVLLKELESNEVTKVFLDEVKVFKMVIDTLAALQDKNLKETSKWSQIPRFLYKCKHPTENLSDVDETTLPLFDRANKLYTVNWLIRQQISFYKDQLCDFGVKAAKEKELNETFTGIQSYLEVAELSLVQCSEGKEGIVLGNNEKMFQTIDDQLMVLNNIMASRYVENFRPEVEQLARQMRYLRDLFDEMQTHQANWTYLQPLLASSSYSSKHLPKQSKQFATCDGLWRRLAKSIRESSNLKRLAADITSHSFMRVLMKNNATFEQIKKSLEEYIERKRISYPRFYFLSNDELLEILSKARTPKTLEPYLYKMFEHVEGFAMDKDQPCGVSNFLGEYLLFKQFSLRPQAQIQQILRAIEQHIKRSLSSALKGTLPKYEQQTINRATLIDCYPFQISSITDWILWTKICEDCLETECPSDQLYEWSDMQNQQIAELTDMIKKQTREKSISIYSAMLLQSIYLKQRTEVLYRKQVVTQNDYNWLMTIKFYLGLSGPELYMKQLGSKIPYGFEFQGPLEPMVITPETQKAWFKLRVIAEHKYYGCIEGDSSTGKSEILRQLAGLLAQSYVVYQCNLQSGLKVMERILVGLCLTGSWATFENYDQVRMETLSVMAGHFQNIRRTLLEGKDSLFLVKGSVNLNPNITISLTRLTQNSNETLLIPECLKSVVRSISLCKLDFSILLSSLFQTEGFLNYESLSTSLSQLLQYCSEIFVYQPSLDFGIRTARLIIKTMRNRTISSSTKLSRLTEQDILYTVANKIIGTNLDCQDFETLQSLLSILSPAIHPAKHEVLDTAKLRANKVEQLCEVLHMKKGAILVGGSLQGKTSLVKLASAAHKKNVKIQFINHESLGLNELFGDVDTNLGGLIPTLIKQAATQKDQPCQSPPTDRQAPSAPPQQEYHWLVLDGKLSPHLLSFAQMADEAVPLALPNGQKLEFGNLRILFETDSLQSAVPSLFSRVGTVSVENTNTIQALIEENLHSIMNEYFNADHRRFLANAMSSSIRKVLVGKKNYSSIVTMNELTVAWNCCNLVKLVLKGFQLKLKDKDAKEVRRLIDKIAIWAVVWGFGATVSTESLSKFEKVIGQIFKLESLPTGNVFNFCLSNSLEWVSWQSTMPIEIINPYEQFSEVLIWTADTHCCGYFIRSFLEFGLPLAILGQSGTGKTAVMRKITGNISRVQNSISNLPIVLSHLSNPAVIQTLLEQRLQWQRRNGHTVLMPPPGKKLLVQIEDINLNNTNSGVLELLRQVISHQGLFDRKTYSWKCVEDLVVNMIGRVPTTDVVNCRRFLTAFSLFSMRQNSQNLTLIFNGLVKSWLKNAALTEDISKLFSSGAIIQSTLKLYNFCKFESKFLSAKQQPYLAQYTSKDVFRVFHSISRISNQVYTKNDQIVRLWANQIMRTFSDRLACKSDKQILYDLLRKQIFLTFKFDLSEGFFKQPLLYALSNDKQQYSLLNYEATCLTLGQKMLQLSPKFSLILYKQLVEHIIHMIRVLTIKFGHFLLVGPRANGKKSITKLACFVAQIEGEFDMKSKFVSTLLRAAEGVPCCLYVSEQNLKTPEEVDKVVCLLNRSIFPLEITRQGSDRLHTLFGEISHARSEPTTNIFFEVVHKYMHVVIASSPSNHLHNLILEYPQLATSCTVDYMVSWPDEALYDVAAINMSEEEFASDQKDRIARIAREFHREVEAVITSQNLNIMISPRKYLELISLFSYKYHVCREESMYTLSMIPKCLEKYALVRDVLQFQKDTLITLQKILKIFDVEPQDSVTLRQALADTTEEDDEEVKKNLTEIVASKSKLRLALRTASEKLNTITRHQILQLRKNPPPQLNLLLQAAANLLQKNVDITKFTNDAGLLWKLKTIQLRSVTKDTIIKVQDLITKMPQETLPPPINALKSFLIQLCTLSESYVKQSQEQIIVLSSAQFNSKCVLAHKICNIQAEYVTSKQVKETLEAEIRLTKDRVRVITQVYEALEGCEVQWIIRLEKQTTRQKNLTYNLFLACAAFGYLGPFSQTNRNLLLERWMKLLENEKACFSNKLEFGQTLFDPFEVESLRSYSEQNLLSCLLMIKSPSVPYFLDSHGISTQYLQSIHPDLKRFKVNEQGFAKILQNCVKSGQVMLLDSVSNIVDVPIRPIINKNFIISGNRKIIRLNDSPIECPESFKLFVSNPDPTAAPDSQIFDNCCVISFDLTDKNITEQVSNDLFSSLLAPVKQQVEQLTGRISQHFIELKTEQQRILKLTDGMNLDTVSSDATAEMYRLKEKREALKVQLDINSKKITELNTERATLQGLVTFAAKLAIFVFRDIEKIGKGLLGDYNLARFRINLQTALVRFLERLDPNAEDRDSFIQTCLIQEVNKSISPKLEQKDRKIFRFLLFVRAQSLLQNQDYHKSLEVFTSPCQLNQTLFMDYSQKLKQIPEMSEFVAVVEKEALEFEAWAAIAKFYDPTLNYKNINLTPYQRLILGKFAKPEDFLNLLDKLLAQYFGQTQISVEEEISQPPNQLLDLLLCKTEPDCQICQQLVTQFLPEPDKHEPQSEPAQGYPLSYHQAEMQVKINNFLSSVKSLYREMPAFSWSLRQTQHMLEQIPVILHVSDRQSTDPIIHCLYRQCEKYNTVVSLMKNDLECVRGYLVQGKPIADNPNRVQKLIQDLKSNRLPQQWRSKYITIDAADGLQGWFEQFKKNHDIIRRWWQKQQRPKYINISCLFYPQYLLTTILLKFAKKSKLKPEKVCFGYKLLTPLQAETNSSPDLAVNISDISLKNCRFDLTKGYLEQCQKATLTKCPVVQLYPMEAQKSTSAFVKIPVYRTINSEELVCSIQLPSKKKADQWQTLKIKAFCQF